MVWRAAAILLMTVAFLGAQSGRAPQQPPASKDELKKRPSEEPKTSDKEYVPPEEDTAIAVTEYSFNPLQAEKELRTGNYYFHKGSYRAAAMRFREATRWNDGSSEAWLRLGEAEEKLKDGKAAREAYTKYLGMATDAKNADEIRKRLRKLK
jgi:tetratricopeptide (TPR) repeat protein